MAIASFVFTAFISAFLLFQVQPLMGKALLPWFGGTPLVWTTCMMFFQALLLAGYAYAHLLVTRCRPAAQWLIHLGVLGVGLAFTALLPEASKAPSGGEPPSLLLIAILATHVGPSFFALSATAPLIQAWYQRRYPEKSPYPLYAVSNAGSLIGVLSYPFLFEPMLTLSAQEALWRIGYLLFGLSLSLAGFLSRRGEPPRQAAAPAADPAGDTEASPSGALPVWTWLALSAAGSVLLLSTTDQISQDLAASPLFWMVPLCLYLVSFILCFAEDRLYHRPLWLTLLPFAVAGVGAQLFLGGGWPVSLQLVFYAVALFIGCMVAHGELARLKPAPAHLSRFYLVTSVGGVLGGLFVAVLAPLLFPDMWEYPLGWIGLYTLVLRARYRDAGFAFFKGRARYFWVLFGSGWLLAATVFVADVIFDHRSASVTARTFYGRVAVFENRHKKCLYHGRIRHGCQWTDPARALDATTYYGPDSGISHAFRLYRAIHRYQTEPSLRIGIIGLGIGTAAAFGQEGELVRFFELDPEVLRLAQEHFSYLSKSPAHVETVIGDGRLSLQAEQRASAPGYDILVLDAFSGDAVPLHLLTTEAFRLYFERIKPDGALVVNISNRHIRLEGLMRGLAAATGTTVFLTTGSDNWENLTYSNTWVIMTESPSLIRAITDSGIARDWPPDRSAPMVFTDQHSNLLTLL